MLKSIPKRKILEESRIRVCEKYMMAPNTMRTGTFTSGSRTVHMTSQTVPHLKQDVHIQVITM